MIFIHINSYNITWSVITGHVYHQQKEPSGHWRIDMRTQSSKLIKLLKDIKRLQPEFTTVKSKLDEMKNDAKEIIGENDEVINGYTGILLATYKEQNVPSKVDMALLKIKYPKA